jgi:hypothetical protein
MIWNNFSVFRVSGDKNMGREFSEVRYRKLTKEEIATLPAKKSPVRSPSRWDPILDDIASGETVAIEVSSDKEFRGSRIGLARVAARPEREMKLDFRKGAQGELVVSLSAEPFRSQNERSFGARRPRNRTVEQNH